MKNRGKIAVCSFFVLFLLVLGSILISRNGTINFNNNSYNKSNNQNTSEYHEDSTNNDAKIPANILYETNTYFILDDNGDLSFNDKMTNEVITYAYKSNNIKSVFDVSRQTNVELDSKVTLNWKELEHVIKKIKTSLLEVKNNEIIIGVFNTFELTNAELDEKIGIIFGIQPYIIEQYLDHGKKVYTYWV